MYGIEGLLAGRTLVDRYRIDAVIGRGGMGAVYRATDERLGRAVAVKVIAVAAPDPDSHARLRARFHREARAAAGLNHPHVVAVYDYGTDPTLDLDFLVMELLRGEDLSARLARSGLPPPNETLTILCQAARGLAAGHRAGLIHRDVKPGNLFLVPADAEGEVHVRVLDFGIAEIVADEQTVTHLTVVGRSPFSPAYAAPEQLRGDSRLTPATDVFSLGAVGYTLLTGERPFAVADPERMRIELSSSLASLRSGPLPPPIRSVLQRALAHDPDDRFADAGELANALAPTLSIPLRGLAPPSTVRPSRPPLSERSTGEGIRLIEEPPLEKRPSPRHAAPRREKWPEEWAGESVGTRVDGDWAAHPPASAPRRQHGWFHRAGVAVWNFLLTLLTLGLLVGAWLLAGIGVFEGEPGQMYAGVAGSVALAPFAAYRVRGRRGSFRWAFLASVAATLATVFLVGTDERPWVLLPTTFLLQLFASFIMLRITRRRGTTVLPEPRHRPVSHVGG